MLGPCSFAVRNKVACHPAWPPLVSQVTRRVLRTMSCTGPDQAPALPCPGQSAPNPLPWSMHSQPAALVKALPTPCPGQRPALPWSMNPQPRAQVKAPPPPCPGRCGPNPLPWSMRPQPPALVNALPCRGQRAPNPLPADLHDIGGAGHAARQEQRRHAAAGLQAPRVGTARGARTGVACLPSC